MTRVASGPLRRAVASDPDLPVPRRADLGSGTEDLPLAKELLLVRHRYVLGLLGSGKSSLRFRVTRFGYVIGWQGQGLGALAPYLARFSQ